MCVYVYMCVCVGVCVCVCVNKGLQAFSRPRAVHELYDACIIMKRYLLKQNMATDNFVLHVA